MARRWSPEQISRALRVDSADELARRLAPESIYQAIYDPACQLVRDRNCMPLRIRLRPRKSHRRPDARRPGGLTERHPLWVMQPKGGDSS